MSLKYDVNKCKRTTTTTKKNLIFEFIYYIVDVILAYQNWVSVMIMIRVRTFVHPFEPNSVLKLKIY